jgi:hypothetical protein
MSKTYKRREKRVRGRKEGKEGKEGKTYKIRKPKKKTRFQSQGFMKTMMSNGSVKNERDIEWNNQYDGKKADLHLMTNLNGKKEKYHIQMNNQEIERLLSQPSVEQRLDKRLIKDFSMD